MESRLFYIGVDSDWFIFDTKFISCYAEDKEEKQK